MGCCGGRVLSYPVATASAGDNGTPRHRNTTPAKIGFQYVGKTRLIVIGPVSGIQYRFRGPGARAMVDPRDQWSLDRVPTLSRVISDDHHP